MEDAGLLVRLQRLRPGGNKAVPFYGKPIRKRDDGDGRAIGGDGSPRPWIEENAGELAGENGRKSAQRGGEMEGGGF